MSVLKCWALEINLDLRKSNKNTDARKRAAKLDQKIQDLATILQQFPNREQARLVVQDLITLAINTRMIAEQHHFTQP